MIKMEGMPLEGSNRSSRGAPLSDCMNLLKSRRQKKSVSGCGMRLQPSGEPKRNIRKLVCGVVMGKPHYVRFDMTLAKIVDLITTKNWDHIFVVDDEKIPMGRIHAVDILKMIAKKTVNRDVAWMHEIQAHALISSPPIKVNRETPLLNAAAILLRHDLNQLPVTDDEGCLCGVISNATITRFLPRYLL
tara:strand:+ start:660 stop:1226 length:567 start_codon:yes stop_codon:yes gene_type:complete